mmetsp:Transcript_4906/g.12451  ORF Transcript_4906/g.12451 Transcript_4906/m.12451 type:complete len:230 (-) Transcript_4906:1405-2094(-)
MGLVQEIVSRLAVVVPGRFRAPRGTCWRGVPHFSNSIPRSPPLAPPPRSPPPAPPQGARHIRRLRLYPAQLLPAVAVAASSSGASPPPPPLPCIRLGFADLLAAGGVGVMGCAADEEGEAGASGTTPAPNHQWDCNPLSKPVRVPFFGTTTTHDHTRALPRIASSTRPSVAASQPRFALGTLGVHRRLESRGGGTLRRVRRVGQRSSLSWIPRMRRMPSTRLCGARSER